MVINKKILVITLLKLFELPIKYRGDSYLGSPNLHCGLKTFEVAKIAKNACKGIIQQVLKLNLVARNGNEDCLLCHCRRKRR